jgi:tRNA dimethylallyltransferase
MNDLKPLVVVLGPTASGKSALGIHLARHLGGEILVCDSTQVYRHFDIGTAKVPASEQHGIPHHLVDLIEPDAVFTAGEYRRHALVCLGQLCNRGKVPVLTAGTGLYLRALLEGLSEAPTRSESLRERLRLKSAKHGEHYLHRLLLRLDPEAAARIERQDTQKVIRAIEIRVLTGKSVGEVHGTGRTALDGYRIIKIGLAPRRDQLYARIDARTIAMLKAGWIDEVRKLLASGLSGDEKPFQFLGYSELRQCVEGHLTEQSAVKQIQQATRQFAKRQITWFRREANVHWLEGFGDDSEILAAALSVTNTTV